MKTDLSRQERAFFSSAKSLLTLSDHYQRVGCVIVDKHHIIGSGHNSLTKCHKFQADLDYKFFKIAGRGPLHAEIDALLPLIKHRYNLAGATVYVYRETKQGIRAMARPCPRCMSVLKSLGIKRIKYSTDDGYASEKII